MRAPWVDRAAERAAPVMLEAIERYAPVLIRDLPEVAGYNYLICFYAVTYLRSLGCATSWRGKVSLTERGMIALAIWRGKQRKTVEVRRAA